MAIPIEPQHLDDRYERPHAIIVGARVVVNRRDSEYISNYKILHSSGREGLIAMNTLCSAGTLGRILSKGGTSKSAFHKTGGI